MKKDRSPLMTAIHEARKQGIYPKAKSWSPNGDKSAKQDRRESKRNLNSYKD